MYVGDHILTTVVNDMTLINDYFEVITLQLIICNIKYLLICVYRPPQSNIHDFNRSFEHHILNKIPPNTKSIICGDFNIDLLNPYDA